MIYIGLIQLMPQSPLKPLNVNFFLPFNQHTFEQTDEKLCSRSQIKLEGL